MMKTVVIAAAAVLLPAPAIAQQAPLPNPPGRLIDIDNRRMHLLCSGLGSPTIVLEAGASSFAIDWTLVQTELARSNRVCSYDRAGMGWSDPDTNGTPSNATSNLHGLLRAGGERPPFVMVGASRGGLMIRSYLLEHPTDVVGLVFVDPSTEDRLFTMYNGQGVTIASLTAEQMRSLMPTGTIAVPRRQPQMGLPFDKLPAALYEIRIKLDERLIASFPDSVGASVVAASQERERAMLARLLATRTSGTAPATPLGNRPTIVLTRGDERNEDRERSHASLAQLSTNSRHRVVSGSGHEIHLFDPAVVVQAINDVVRAHRANAALRPAGRRR